MAAPKVVVLNAGSSSVKFALFSGSSRTAGASIDRDGGSDVGPVIDEVLARLSPHGGLTAVTAIGHRIVHGGSTLSAPTVLDAAALEVLARLESIDPNHLPAQLSIVRAFSARAPGVPQVGCFDTAFHATVPRVARLFAIPRRFEAHGIRRYGFHGLSYQFQMAELRRLGGPSAERGRVVMAHLGAGSSLAAAHDGRCIDTTMAFSPNSGVVMSTRSGDLDPGLLVYLMQTEKWSADEIERVLTKESGLLGVSGVSADMRDLLAREESDPACADAVALYCYTVRKAIGALASALDGLDTLVFAAGIGENSPVVRARVCEGLRYLGITLDPAKNQANEAVISKSGTGCTVRIVRTDEEVVIAREALRAVTGEMS